MFTAGVTWVALSGSYRLTVVSGLIPCLTLMVVSRGSSSDLDVISFLGTGGRAPFPMSLFIRMWPPAGVSALCSHHPHLRQHRTAVAGISLSDTASALRENRGCPAQRPALVGVLQPHEARLSPNDILSAVGQKAVEGSGRLCVCSVLTGLFQT